MSKSMKPAAVLERALKRLGPKGGRLVRDANNMAENANGRNVDCDSPRACRWCVLGAIWREGAPSFGDEEVFLRRAMGTAFFTEYLARYRSRPKVVLAAFRKAIALAKKAEGA